MRSDSILFDINETVLDLAALDPLFVAWFADASARRVWFSRTLHLALTFAATREYRDFADIGRAALDDLAQERSIALPQNATIELRHALLHLPAHPDVAPACRQLSEAGFRLAALSNNPLDALRLQLQNAGIAPLFSDVISVAEAGALKPSPEVYHFAARRLDRPPNAIWMVAAHGWDIAGASRAGLRGAFVARPGQLPDPFAPPQIIANDLVSISSAITTASQTE